ncbi:MAG: hypothetical protein F6K26_06545 [Moorea sp. SIO2I5]|nr:hypothetical protein [Moorena sp. SIO2I5]
MFASILIHCSLFPVPCSRQLQEVYYTSSLCLLLSSVVLVLCYIGNLWS